ncbi:hypothetical protein [Paenibacillus terrigena]|uniref:hypothetical protein n=1 Tax=Paenibacillus terrigena TaxID=369333 RepID=UPI0028D25556|nr:hypothetical protein [Paenibacillus terrigena]
MDPKKIIMISFMAFVIACSSSIWSNEANASASTYKLATDGLTSSPDADDLLQALGVESEEQIYDALYSGQSLADIASDNKVEVDQIVDLQVAQLRSQLDQRFLSGSISLEAYQAQVEEIHDMIQESVHRKMLQ